MTEAEEQKYQNKEVKGSRRRIQFQCPHMSNTKLHSIFWCLASYTEIGEMATMDLNPSIESQYVAHIGDWLNDKLLLCVLVSSFLAN